MESYITLGPGCFELCSCCCLAVSVLCLYHKVPIEAFPGHTHLHKSIVYFQREQILSFKSSSLRK